MYFCHRMVSPTGHLSDDHISHRHDLAILGFLNEDGNTAWDELTVKLDTLGPSYELPITVVACNDKKKKKRGGNTIQLYYTCGTHNAGVCLFFPSFKKQYMANCVYI